MSDKKLQLKQLVECLQSREHAVSKIVNWTLSAYYLNPNKSPHLLSVGSGTEWMTMYLSKMYSDMF